MFTANIAGLPVELDLNELRGESIAFLLEYGLRQYVQDGAAVSLRDKEGNKRPDDEVAAERQEGVRQRLANISDGTFVRRNTAGAKASPEDRERKAYILEVIRKAAKATGKTMPKVDSEVYKNIAAAYYEKNRTAVDKEVARRVKATASGDGIEDLLEGL